MSIMSHCNDLGAFSWQYLQKSILEQLYHKGKPFEQIAQPMSLYLFADRFLVFIYVVILLQPCP